MTLKEFEKKLNDLNDEIRDNISDNENEIFPIFDGPLSVKEYFNAPIKIMWLMKEAYDDEGNGDWSFTDFYTNDYQRFYTDLVRGKSNKTWQPVVYTTYGILKECNNEYIEYDHIPFIWNKPEIVKCLSNIAWVNIQKLPSKNGTNTDMNHIKEAFDLYFPIINKQIELLNPDIIICGGLFRTPGFLEKIFGYSIKEKLDSKSWVEYSVINDKLVISAYHPSYVCDKEKYINEIIDVVRNKFNKQK